MVGKNKYIVTLLLTLISLAVLAFLWYGRDNKIYSIDPSDPMQHVSEWKPHGNKNQEYGIALRLLALRRTDNQKIVWVYNLEEYPNDYFAKAGFFNELTLSGDNLWFLVTNRISKSEVAVLDLNRKKIKTRYNIPDQSYVFVDTLNTEKLFVVISMRKDDMEKLILYSLSAQEQILLDMTQAGNEGSFSSQWQNIHWINETTLEYLTTAGKKKRIVI